jgi:DNA-binding response OmpR family regulator
MVCVLLVEDEREIAELARDALSEAGFSVTVALDDQSASRTLEREARSFAALVTDINLGAGVTGFDLARRARSLNADIEVVYISGQGPHAGRFGVDRALTVEKPFDPRNLAEQVASLIEDEDAS